MADEVLAEGTQKPSEDGPEKRSINQLIVLGRAREGLVKLAPLGAREAIAGRTLLVERSEYELLRSRKLQVLSVLV